MFKKPMQASDVEISDDIYIVTAEEAAKHVEPQRLTSITLMPESISLQPGQRIQFHIEARDQHGRSMAAPNPKWSATGGTIEPNGTYVAGQSEGSFAVELVSGDVRGSAAILVTRQPAPATGATGGSTTSTAQPKSPESVAAVQWSGQVPTAKWMTFYTKVLAKYAKEKGLTLKASFVLSPEHGLTPQHINELRSALRELGLDDDVQTTTN